MQIEIIGCTGAGKTTLMSKLAQQSQHENQSQNLPLQTSYDFVLSQFGFAQVQPHKLRMLLLNLIALFVCLLAVPKHWRFAHFIGKHIWNLPTSVGRVNKLKIARIALRNLGIYEIIALAAPSQAMIAADEGTIQIAHYLFAHLAVEPDAAAVSEFVKLAPLPDQLLYLRPNEAVMIERTLLRGHNRIADRSPQNVERFIRHTVQVFDQIAREPRLQARLAINDGNGVLVLS